MESNHITLRPLCPEDQAQILETVTSNQVNRTYMLPDFETPEDAIPLFNRLMTLSNDSGRFVRCIDLEGTAIGFLNDVETKEKTMELGYVIHPDYHNRGYMTRALKLAISQLFELGYERIVCGAFEQNRASQRVMEKAGMHRIAFTEEIEYRGSIHMCIYYETKSEETQC